MTGVRLKGVKIRGATVAHLPSHHVARLDHRIPKRGIVATVDHHIANLPASPTVLEFSKSKDSDFLRVLTGRRGKVRHEKGFLERL